PVRFLPTNSGFTSQPTICHTPARKIPAQCVHKAVALDTVFRRQAQGLYDPFLKTGTMPVYVENLSLASPQDRRDLELIYADAPEWLLTPYPQASALIDAALANQCLLVGRFNGRLLGAARLERLADRWRLTHLCVR